MSSRSLLKVRGSILEAMDVVVAVVQEVDMAVDTLLATWQPHPLKIPDSSHPLAVNEILLVSPISSKFQGANSQNVGYYF
uniref:Uncharacterized protein n=1 Tax=Cannabis sativa TaxID=3483 RepID=A0A803QUP5_CANSA